MYQRSGVSNLVVTLILVVGTLSFGLIYGVNLQDRVNLYLDVMEGEILSATAVYRDDILHVRVDLRHVAGPGFDRVAVSELAIHDSYIELITDELDYTTMDVHYTTLDYEADGWGHTGSIPVNTTAWPPGAAPTGRIDVYQRVGDSDVTDDILVSDGRTITLEFILAGVDITGTKMGVSLEYGNAERTKHTDNVDVALYTP